MRVHLSFAASRRSDCQSLTILGSSLPKVENSAPSFVPLAIFWRNPPKALSTGWVSPWVISPAATPVVVLYPSLAR